ncbi:MAG: hypothetical protein IKR41_09485 [Bacteroidales bacterium]|jgi:RNA recognition motif-containing protein|nr:hypothetical protein [Bacteroidales bacterium]
MNIYIANLSHNVTDEDLKDLFSTYGTINSVKVIIDKETGESKGFGFVEMPNDEEGMKAIEDLNGKPLHFEGEEETSDSKVVKVSVARPRQAVQQPQRNVNQGYRPNQGYPQRRSYYAPQGGYRNNNQGGFRPRRAPYGGQGYNQGYNNQGYNQGYNNQGYNQGYNQGSNQGSEEIPQNGGYAQNNGYQGYNNQGYRPRRYNNQGYNRGYNQGGYNRGYNQGYNNQGYNNQGYNNQGYNNQGYNNQGYSSQSQEREFNAGTQSTENFTTEQNNTEGQN